MEKAASQQNAVREYLAARLDASLTKEAASGTTLVDIGSKSYVQRLQNNLTVFPMKAGYFIWRMGFIRQRLGTVTGGDRN